MGKQKLGRLYEEDLAQVHKTVEDFKVRTQDAWNKLNELEGMLSWTFVFLLRRIQWFTEVLLTGPFP